jgi:hypothetical protein
MKILVSQSFGNGFDINLFAVEELLKRKGLEAFFYIEDYFKGCKTFRKILPTERLSDYSLFYDGVIVTIIDLGEELYSHEKEGYEYDFYIGDLRKDETLIEIYEEYGGNKISNCGLILETIPNGTNYYIEDCDGSEYIVLQNRIKWLTAEDNY